MLAATVFVAAQWALGAPSGMASSAAILGLQAADIGIASPGRPGAVVPAGGSVAVLATGDRVVVDRVGGAAPRALLLVDDHPAGDFSTGSVTVDVAPGQLLAIDGRAYARPLVFRVAYAGPDLASPSAGARVATLGDIVLVGRVTPR